MLVVPGRATKSIKFSGVNGLAFHVQLCNNHNFVCVCADKYNQKICVSKSMLQRAFAVAAFNASILSILHINHEATNEIHEGIHM